MECLYCKEEIIEGYIYGVSYALNWLSENKNSLVEIFSKLLSGDL